MAAAQRITGARKRPSATETIRGFGVERGRMEALEIRVAALEARLGLP